MNNVPLKQTVFDFVFLLVLAYSVVLIRQKSDAEAEVLRLKARVIELERAGEPAP